MLVVVPVVPYLLYIVYIEYIVTVLTESSYIYMNDSPVIQVYPCIEFLKVHCISIYYFILSVDFQVSFIYYNIVHILFLLTNWMVFYCYFKIIYTSDRAYFYKLYLVIQREIDYYKLLVLLLYFLNVFGKNIVSLLKLIWIHKIIWSPFYKIFHRSSTATRKTNQESYDRFLPDCKDF